MRQQAERKGYAMPSLERTLGRTWRLGLVLFSLISGLLFAASGAAAPTIFFEPTPICGGEPGTEFETSIWIDASGDSIGCFHLLLTYDRDRLTLLDADEGALFRDAPYSTLFIWEYPGIDTTAFTDCLLGNRTYVLGPGELVRLTFRVEACPPDTAGLLLVEHRFEPPPEDYAFLADIDRQPIDGVTYRSDLAWLCDECASSAPEAIGAPSAALSLSPNPARSRVRVDWNLPEGADRGWIELFAPDGRKILEERIDRSTGGREWDLRDREGLPLPSGAYFARLRAGERTVCRRILKVD